MKKSSKFSDVLHILLHMATSSEAVTSETLAKAMQTNPVVVRRMMAGLRERGLVRSEKGHGGGWELSCDLTKVTLLDIYKAVESPTLLAMGNRNENSKCRVEKAVNDATQDALEDAEALLLRKFRGVTLAKLQASIKKGPSLAHIPNEQSPS
ncbi:MAG TPA: Rrf2 family transcriptional regulator [Candidatus Paceibacterota bacterium]|nr:Rrf2 family transcriptional regulator [Candidatus Paceibacterota bacterium]